MTNSKYVVTIAFNPDTTPRPGLLCVHGLLNESDPGAEHIVPIIRVAKRGSSEEVSDVRLLRGDTVQFIAEGYDIVVQLDPDMFGGHRFPIPQGQHLILEVKKNADESERNFEFLVFCDTLLMQDDTISHFGHGPRIPF